MNDIENPKDIARFMFEMVCTECMNKEEELRDYGIAEEEIVGIMNEATHLLIEYCKKRFYVNYEIKEDARILNDDWIRNLLNQQ